MLLFMWSCRRGAGPVWWPIRGGRARQVDGVQLQGQPPRRAEWPAARQTGVRLFHQNMGAGLRRDRGDALLLPPQHHQGTLRALPAGDGSGNSHTELFRAVLRQKMDSLRSQQTHCWWCWLKDGVSLKLLNMWLVVCHVYIQLYRKVTCCECIINPVEAVSAVYRLNTATSGDFWEILA